MSEELKRLESVEAERAVLSAVLQNPDNLLMQAWEKLQSIEAFTFEPHRIVWETLIEMHGASLPLADPVVVTQTLADKDLLDKIGGRSWITELFTCVTIASHFEHWLAIMQEKWLLRQLVEVCREGQARAIEAGREDIEISAAEIIGKTEEEVFQVLTAAQKKRGGVENEIVDNRTMNQLWLEHFEKICANRGKVIGISTGWFDVDRQFHGLAPEGEGDLMLFGAFPGMGKTTAGVTLLENIAIEQGVPTLVFPLEMGRQGWAMRLNLGRANVDTAVGRNGFATKRLWAELPGVLGQTKGAPIYWDPSSSITTSELRAKVQTQVRRHGIKCVILDHFGQLKPSTKQGVSDERLGQKEIMECLHSLRRDLGILIVVFVQLDKKARENQARNLPPGNGDIRGASEMVDYPTQIVMLHRPNVVRPWAVLSDDVKERWENVTAGFRKDCPECWAGPEDKGKAEWKTLDQVDYEEHALLRITKNRNGPTDDGVCVRFRAALQRITNRTSTLYSNNDNARQVRLPGF